MKKKIILLLVLLMLFSFSASCFADGFFMSEEEKHLVYSYFFGSSADKLPLNFDTYKHLFYDDGAFEIIRSIAFYYSFLFAIFALAIELYKAIQQQRANLFKVVANIAIVAFLIVNFMNIYFPAIAFVTDQTTHFFAQTLKTSDLKKEDVGLTQLNRVAQKHEEQKKTEKKKEEEKGVLEWVKDTFNFQGLTSLATAAANKTVAGLVTGLLIFLTRTLVITLLSLQRLMLVFFSLLGPPAIVCFLLPGTEAYFKGWLWGLADILSWYPLSGLVLLLQSRLFSKIWHLNNWSSGEAILAGDVVVFAALIIITFFMLFSVPQILPKLRGKSGGTIASIGGAVMAGLMTLKLAKGGARLAGRIKDSGVIGSAASGIKKAGKRTGEKASGIARRIKNRIDK